MVVLRPIVASGLMPRVASDLRARAAMRAQDTFINVGRSPVSMDVVSAHLHGGVGTATVYLANILSMYGQ